MKAHILGAFAALLFAVPATDVAAKSVKIEAVGTISSGSDGTGAFGGGVMAGRAFSFAATFDLSNAYYFDFGSRTDLVGGEAYSFLPEKPPSMGNGTMTVNGIDQVIEANWFTNLTAFAGGFDQQALQQRNQSGGDLFIKSVVFTEQPGYGVFGPDYVPPTGNLCGPGRACDTGNMSIERYSNGALLAQTFLQLTATSLTITEVVEPSGPVPEPATWALMIGGFGLAGGALRRRRATATA